MVRRLKSKCGGVYSRLFKPAKDSIMSREATQKSGVPQIMKLDMALNLAEQWVNNMTEVSKDEQIQAESKG
ncbi:hypothetical protein NL676_030003 [Syzygium grande]|nr:hypothetical protein NL676_030003 [Syzygium grande]